MCISWAGALAQLPDAAMKRRCSVRYAEFPAARGAFPADDNELNTKCHPAGLFSGRRSSLWFGTTNLQDFARSAPS